MCKSEGGIQVRRCEAGGPAAAAARGFLCPVGRSRPVRLALPSGVAISPCPAPAFLFSAMIVLPFAPELRHYMGQAGRGATALDSRRCPTIENLARPRPRLVVEVAGGEAPRRDFLERRPLDAAAREGERAAGVEMAAGRRIERGGDLALDRRRTLLARVEPRHLGEQRLGVGVVRAANSGSVGASSTMRPRYITTTRSAMCCDHAEIVADEEVGQPELPAQLHEQVQHLRLDRDVERRDRLVADQQLRAAPRARARCRCGRAARRRTGADSGRMTAGSSPTRLSISHDIVVASRARGTIPCTTGASPMMSTTRRRGLSDAIGSWKIICTASAPPGAPPASSFAHGAPAIAHAARARRPGCRRRCGRASTCRSRIRRPGRRPRPRRSSRLDVVDGAHDLVASARAEQVGDLPGEVERLDEALARRRRAR